MTLTASCQDTWESPHRVTRSRRADRNSEAAAEGVSTIWPPPPAPGAAGWTLCRRHPGPAAAPQQHASHRHAAQRTRRLSQFLPGPRVLEFSLISRTSPLREVVLTKHLLMLKHLRALRQPPFPDQALADPCSQLLAGTGPVLACSPAWHLARQRNEAGKRQGAPRVGIKQATEQGAIQEHCPEKSQGLPRMGAGGSLWGLIPRGAAAEASPGSLRWPPPSVLGWVSWRCAGPQQGRRAGLPECGCVHAQACVLARVCVCSHNCMCGCVCSHD